MDQATLNGNVTATGGENVTRGFRWGTNLGGPYPNSWSDTGTHGAGVYSHTIVGLAKDITFYYTAVATNCRGTSYGAEQAFNSNPATPTNLAGVCVGFIVPNIIPIMLTWTDNSSIETAYYVSGTMVVGMLYLVLYHLILKPIPITRLFVEQPIHIELGLTMERVIPHMLLWEHLLLVLVQLHRQSQKWKWKFQLAEEDHYGNMSMDGDMFHLKRFTEV